MASVRKRRWTHKGVEKEKWVVTYTDQGGKRRLKTFDTKKDADRYRTKVEVEIERGEHVADAKTVTFGKAYDAWYADCERRHKIGDRMAGGTLYVYRNFGEKHVRPTFGHRKLTELTSREVQDFLDEKRSEYAYRTVQRLLVIVQNVIAFALGRDWLHVNPLTKRPVRVPANDTRERAIPSKDEIVRILQVVSTRQMAAEGRSERRAAFRNRLVLATLALFAGMRRGEICGLQWENIDFEAGVINIKHSLSSYDGLKDPKSKAGIRTVPMAPPVRKVLEMVSDNEKRDTGYVLLNVWGTPLRPESCSLLWRYVMNAAGLMVDGRPRYSLHALRHAAVSLLIEQGLDAFVIKDLIGHSSVKTTMDVYGHLFPEDERGKKAIEAAASQFQLPPVALTATTSQRQISVTD